MIFEDPDEGEQRLATPALLGFVAAASMAVLVAIFIVPNVLYRLGELSALAFGS
jgi:hypothetical protein